MTQRGPLKWALVILGLTLTVSSAYCADSNPEKFWGMPWLPEGTSSYAQKIDDLFYFIFYLTGFVFVVTEGLLLLFVIMYRKRDGAKSVYSHGNHKLELAWTLIPAAILGTIAILQKSTWDEIKKPENFPSGPNVVHIQTFAKQFEWNFRYAGADGKWGTPDDIVLNNRLIVPVNHPIVMEQASLDVIHSFYLPNMRLKQDVVPGMQIKVWFEPIKTSAEMRKTRGDYVKPDVFKKPGQPDTGPEQWTYEIVCAELCGMQHGEMRGSMEVMDQADYDAWFAKASKDAAEYDKPEIWNHWEIANPETGERKFPVRTPATEAKKEE
jgi:cytochrome c oxidase subunit 2